MRGSVLTLFIAAVSLSPSSGHAQQPWEPAASLNQALARAIETALPREGHDQALTWSGFGLRGGQDVFWHLLTPEHASEERQQRRGWISVQGASGDVMLCGDRVRVDQMDVRVVDIWRESEDIPEFLRRRGVAVTLIETRPHVPLDDIAADDGRRSEYYRALLNAQPAVRRWRLEAPQRLPATLTARHGCTPPGTRSATQCMTLWSLRFADGEAADRPIPCLGLGHYRHF